MPRSKGKWTIEIVEETINYTEVGRIESIWENKIISVTHKCESNTIYNKRGQMLFDNVKICNWFNSIYTRDNCCMTQIKIIALGKQVFQKNNNFLTNKQLLLKQKKHSSRIFSRKHRKKKY